MEEKLKKQAEENHFLAKSLAGLTAEMKLQSSHQAAVPQRAPVQDAAWPQLAASQAVSYGPPRQAPMPYPNQGPTPHNYNQY